MAAVTQKGSIAYLRAHFKYIQTFLCTCTCQFWLFGASTILLKMAMLCTLAVERCKQINVLPNSKTYHYFAGYQFQLSVIVYMIVAALKLTVT